MKKNFLIVVLLTAMICSSCKVSKHAVNNLSDRFESKVNELVEEKASSKVFSSGSVQKIIDGDTLDILPKGEKKAVRVRLIGIDTPESVSKSDRLVNTDYGKKVSKYVKKLLPKRTKVWLKYDQQTEDTYGRTLAYVYYMQNEKKVMLNKYLVKKGYARAVYYKPNKKYRHVFKKCHLYAKKHKKGFWKDGFKTAFPTKKEKEY